RPDGDGPRARGDRLRRGAPARPDRSAPLEAAGGRAEAAEGGARVAVEPPRRATSSMKEAARPGAHSGPEEGVCRVASLYATKVDTPTLARPIRIAPRPWTSDRRQPSCPALPRRIRSRLRSFGSRRATPGSRARRPPL